MTSRTLEPPAVGNWGMPPGQNLASVHLNLVISEFRLDRFSIAGPAG